MHSSFFTKWQDVFCAMTGQPASKQTRCPFGDDDLLVRRYVVAVRVRNESKALGVPRIQPQVLLRQIDPSLVTNVNHKMKLTCRLARAKSVAAQNLGDVWYPCFAR